jgi:hypothetical protein
MTLVRKNKAILVEENQPHFSARLREALEKVLDPSTYGAMKSAPQGEVKLNAARTIAEGIFALVTSHKEPRQS